MEDLERRAMLGDKQAQRECTEKGIVLQCPWCKKVPTEEDIFPDYAGWIIYHDCKIAGHMRVKAKTRFDLILKWNTRPAPPVGRCDQCINAAPNQYFGEDCYWCDVNECNMEADDYCSYFEEAKR